MPAGISCKAGEIPSPMQRLSDYDYELPPERIAQSPAVPRDSSRLLVLDRKTGGIKHESFGNIGNYLSSNDLLVTNNTRVMPARIFGKKASGGKVELLLLHENEKNLWECLVRPGRRLPTGTVLKMGTVPKQRLSREKELSPFSCFVVPAAPAHGVTARIMSRAENGTRLVRFEGVADLRDYLRKLGEIPFPPYVTERTCDPEQYQTVYAKEEGSVAAPTAGLHFTESLLEDLRSRGVSIVEVTLHVGWGTFRPVRSETIADHVMEKEWYSILPESASLLNQAQRSGKRIVAVGTTACRVLESLPGDSVSPASGWTNLFIYPGFQFRRVDALITNFHLPRSTLLTLVCAFAGRDSILRAYQQAIEKGYRFYSFGDAMLIV